MDVLVSGASMAGLSAAHWFARLGHRVTVVERSDGLRPGGAPIDVRGRALGTAERMGILAQIDKEKVVVLGPAPVLDGTGTQVATLDLRWFANETDEDIEITRDRLNQILLKVVPDDVEFRYNTSITSIADGQGGADVVFTDGQRAAITSWSAPTGCTPTCASWPSVPRRTTCAISATTLRWSICRTIASGGERCSTSPA